MAWWCWRWRRHGLSSKGQVIIPRRCASGSCDERKVCCNVFRYGQCHQEIACYGPIVCRVVSCDPPWTFDESCSRDVLVDNATAQHSAPCLAPGCPPPPTTVPPAPVANPVANLISTLLQTLRRALSPPGR